VLGEKWMNQERQTNADKRRTNTKHNKDESLEKSGVMR